MSRSPAVPAAASADGLAWETSANPAAPHPAEQAFRGRSPNQVPTPALPIDEGEQPVRPHDRPGPVLATIDFDSATLDQNLLKAISQALWSRLDAMPDLAVYPRNPVRRWLIRHDLFPFTPYMPPVPPDKITAFLKADYLMAGYLERVGNLFSLDLSLYSDRAKKTILKDIKLQKADLEELIDSFSAVNMRINQAIQANELELQAHGPSPTKQPPAVEPASPSAPAKVLPPAPSPTLGPPVGAIPLKPKSNRKNRAEPATAAEGTTTTLRSDEQPYAAAPTPKPTPKPTPRPTPTAAPTAAPTKAPAPQPTPRATPRATATPAAAAPGITSATAAEESAADIARAQALYQEAMKAGANPAERLQKLEQAAALSPRGAGIQQALALEYYNQGKHESVLVQIDKALRAQPGNSMLLTIKGSSIFELGRFAEAATTQEEALRLDPKNFWAAFNLALALTQQRSERAAPAWRNFLTLTGGDPAVPRELGDRARQYLAAVTPTPVPPSAR